MSWKKGTKPKHNQQEVAEQVLQAYIKALQDNRSLKSILSEFCVLDYFGKVFYGQENVASHLISNLHGSNFELSSLSVSDQPSVIQWDLNDSQDKVDDDLGVSLISPPKFTFPSITFSTPVRSFSVPRKRSASEASVEDGSSHVKICKTENSAEEGSSSKKTGEEKNMLSPQSVQAMFDQDLKYLTAHGTIRCPKRVLPTMDLKRIKHHSSIALRGRFCQLFIGFESGEHLIGLTNLKIRTIKYNFSSKVTPRNLLKAFNEVEMNLNNKVINCKTTEKV